MECTCSTGEPPHPYNQDQTCAPAIVSSFAIANPVYPLSYSFGFWHFWFMEKLPDNRNLAPLSLARVGIFWPVEVYRGLSVVCRVCDCRMANSFERRKQERRRSVSGFYLNVLSVMCNILGDQKTVELGAKSQVFQKKHCTLYMVNCCGPTFLSPVILWKSAIQDLRIRYVSIAGTLIGTHQHICINLG